MIELEKTYLAKIMPAKLSSFPSKKLIDIYLPTTSSHPILRIRKNGEVMEITKKQPLADDTSEMREDTISLSKDEYEELSTLPGKRIEKTRYAYTDGITNFEIDVFTGDLLGLVLVDVEFNSVSEKNTFTMPTFCLEEVTDEQFIAGGMLCGKTYKDIEDELRKHHYSALHLPQ